MFHTGDRVLVLTMFGELPARIVGFDGERIMVTCPPFYFGQFLAWRADVRVPLDGAADERMSEPGSLTTARPAFDYSRPDPSQAGWPAPRKRVRRMDRDVDSGGGA